MPQLKERHKLREDFLDAFVRALIINSFDEEKAKKEKEKEIKEQIEKTNSMPMIHRDEIKKPLKKITPILHPFQEPRGQIQKKAPIPLPKTMPQAKSKKQPQKPETINLGKIAQVLLDPAVFSVECPGPGKNILVNRGGRIQASSLALAPEEIQTIMENFSEKTRIPLISGVFKAAYKDLIATAVVSDFVGTRFMIQKRTPFQRY
ncbi:MAG: hypothetical protein KJ718_06315 [Nanoarchaeota archaeon]|nr:hypothetical protein [Nanoarchaeota archaeon]MBU1052131.1 hypothetical protein [Nanoarchaeota archaeon]MBU1987863.1 hypothetical protein [Nanoarchaeota archaeon]